MLRVSETRGGGEVSEEIAQGIKRLEFGSPEPTLGEKKKLVAAEYAYNTTPYYTTLTGRQRRANPKGPLSSWSISNRKWQVQ